MNGLVKKWNVGLLVLFMIDILFTKNVKLYIVTQCICIRNPTV